MQVGDYYCPETVTSAVAFNLGRSVRTVQVTTVEAINPLKASVAVAAVWGGLAALINARKHRQGRMTKRDALLDTAGETAGIGLASGLGLLASNAARAAVAATSASSFVPYMIGVVVTAGVKTVWDCTTQRYLATCPPRPGLPATQTSVPGAAVASCEGKPCP